MNIRNISLIIFLSICGISQLKSQDSVLKYLPGVWMNTSQAEKREIWEKNESGWSGKAVKLKADTSIVWERLQIFSRGDSLFYTADVIGNSRKVEFYLLLSTDWEMVFVNFKHDFPKVIHYRMPAKNFIYAEVYGDNYSERLKFNFYRKEE